MGCLKVRKHIIQLEKFYGLLIVTDNLMITKFLVLNSIQSNEVFITCEIRYIGNVSFLSTLKEVL